MAEENEKELQQKYLEMRLIEQQIKQVQQQAQQVDQQIVELNNIKSNLDDFAKTKIGSEILVPISPGIFVKGELKDNKELIVNVGENTAVKKDIPETKKLIDDQLKEMERAHGQILQSLQELVLQAQLIEKDMEKLFK